MQISIKNYYCCQYVVQYVTGTFVILLRNMPLQTVNMVTEFTYDVFFEEEKTKQNIHRVVAMLEDIHFTRLCELRLVQKLITALDNMGQIVVGYR